MTVSGARPLQIPRKPLPASFEHPRGAEIKEHDSDSRPPDPTHAKTSAATTSNPSSAPRATFRTWLDKSLPPHKRYCRMRRRTFIIVLATIVLALLALIIGLAAGLSARAKANANPAFLPLPSDRQHFTGDLTYYGTGLGACGVTSSASDNIVSVSHFLFDHEQSGSNPNTNPLCGLVIRAERYDEQVGANRSLDLTVVDRCTGCQPTDLDVSTGAFAQLAEMDKGRVQVTWAWLAPVPTG